MAKKRQKVKRFSVQGFDNKHYRLTDQYTKAVNALFDKATSEITKSIAKGTYNPSKLFSFDDYPKAKAVAGKEIAKLAANITTVIESGSRKQWLFANQKNDEFINSVVDTTKLTKAQLKKLQDRNLEALQSFQQRKIGGMDLSQRVWKYVGQYKEQIELGLDVGIGDGRSASQLSRDVRQYLKDPNRLYRRVRDKHGNLVLSKAAKAFNPGVGVYRSSAKNAMRLTRTEINMAYRESDWLRWQQLDFVVGFEVKRSNHEPLFKCKLCDRLQGKYPKAFKFRGWHPQCMCHATPIIEDYFSETRKENRVNRLKAALNGTESKKYVSKETVTEMPQGFKDWVAENTAKQANWNSTPYFIRDNFVNANLADGLKYDAPKVPEIKIRIKTDAEKADIQKRWNTRLATNQYGASIEFAIAEYDKVPSLQKHLVRVQKAIKDGVPLDAIDAMMNKFDHKVLVKAAWDERVENNQLGVLLANVQVAKAQFGLSAVKLVYGAVESKLDTFKHLSIESQIEKLKFEVDWVEKHKKYDTWKVARDAYKKRLLFLENELKWKDVNDEIAYLKAFKTRSKVYVDLIAKIEIAKKTGAGIDYVTELVYEAENLKYKLENRGAKNTAATGKTLDELKKELGANLPKTLENLGSKISRFKSDWTLEEQRDALRKVKEVLDNGDLGMNVPLYDRNGNDVIEAIFSSYFKTQIETGTGKGMVDVEERKNASNVLFGTNIKNTKPVEYEKYGFLMDKDILKQAKSGIANQYWSNGNGIQVRFKRDKVIATFTSTDSLGSGLKPSLISDPKVSSLQIWNYFKNKTANHKDIVDSTSKYAGAYFELQYHGKLTLDAIESVYIPASVMPKISKATFRTMQLHNMIVYSEKNGRLITLNLKDYI